MSLITIDIGANDPDSCITRPSVVKLVSCASRAIPAATANLAKILASLRRAAPGTRMIAMDYYLPALAQWRNGLVGQALARLSELAASGYNALLTRTYQAFGVRVADVSAVFQSADFGQQVSLPGYGALPRNVAAICKWTWECAAPPRGPNEHPNQAGYAVIARAFQRPAPASSFGVRTFTWRGTSTSGQRPTIRCDPAGPGCRARPADAGRAVSYLDRARRLDVLAREYGGEEVRMFFGGEVVPEPLAVTRWVRSFLEGKRVSWSDRPPGFRDAAPGRPTVKRGSSLEGKLRTYGPLTDPW